MKLIKLDAIDSTNDYLKALGRKVDLEDEVMVVAQNQIRGRGQSGAQWYTEAGKSLSFSLFKRFQGLEATRQFAFSCAVSLGIKKGMEQIGIENLNIKWPNDIMADDKKLCGILIENQLQAGAIVSSVIGVGINVNNLSFPNLPNASSLLLTVEKEFDIDTVLQVVVDCISSEMERVEDHDFDALKFDYERNLFRINTNSVFQNKKGQRINAIIRGISSTGLLQLELER